ncbi:MAG: hypothetical protein VXZ51_02855 [Actinomycetota bacterium]|nr:hypothetical protein [Actinomycetota bacterium]|tara:strand:+ start:2072 stop:2641 length:570 start_codon:yes stop_codon:yes gene_type:complete
MSSPELIIFTGPMFGGKTSRLLAAVERYQYQKKKILCFKPDMDDRYNKESIVTHSSSQSTLQVQRVSSGQDICTIVDTMGTPDVIAVDEAFMIPGAAQSLINLYFQGVTVLVSSLQLSYECKPFEEMQQLLPYATRVEVCPAVCAKCDRDAFYTHRKVSGDETLMIGGVNMYEPLCYYHYKEFVNVSSD